MEIKQTQKVTQTLSLTPQMKQSLHILQLPLLELKNYVEVKLEENPTLETEPPQEAQDSEERIERLIERHRDWQDYSLMPSPDEIKKKRDYKETLISEKSSLYEYLRNQLRLLNLTEKQFKLAEIIIGNLDDNGYLDSSCEEIVATFCNKYPQRAPLTKEEVKEILTLIHTLDPLGVGARNLKECLLIQLAIKNRQTSLAYKIIKYHLSDLIKNRLEFIAKKMRINIDEVKKAKKEISFLEPKPGRNFSQTLLPTTLFSSIDIIVEPINDIYEIIINMKNVPKLKVNSYYLQLLKSKKISPQIKEYIQKKIKAALGLIKAIAQREETIRKTVRHIITIQKDFFEYGNPALLKPLTLKDVAHIAQRNESTISRVVNNKYIKTPFGVYRLDYFFTKSLPSEGGEVSQEHIKCKIFNFVEEENPHHPLKDRDIALLLKKEGIRVARRTVAKYRRELKILPFNQRKVRG